VTDPATERTIRDRSNSAWTSSTEDDVFVGRVTAWPDRIRAEEERRRPMVPAPTEYCHSESESVGRARNSMVQIADVDPNSASYLSIIDRRVRPFLSATARLPLLGAR